MDGSTLPAPLYTALGSLIPLAIAAAVVRSPWFKVKGKAGQAVVNLAAIFKNHRQHVAYRKHVLANRESVPLLLEILGREGSAHREAWGEFREGVFGCQALPRGREIVGAS